MGGSWLQSDVKKEKLGNGAGFTFGQSYLQNKTSPIDIGWRIRFLGASANGQDLKRSTGIANNIVLNGLVDPKLNYNDSVGYVYHNYRTSISEFSLEFLIGANSLREQTKIYPYIFGGAGLVKATAKINQLNSEGKRYNYSKIDSAVNAGAILEYAIDDIHDGTYETTAEGNSRPRWKFMPSLGVGLGYQFSKSFSLYVEHKVTWALHDVLDGQQWNNNNTLSGNNDLYHYSSLGMKISFGRKTKAPKQAAPTPAPVPVDQASNYTPPAPPAGQAPIVTITNPSSNPYAAPQKNMTITAQVDNVSSRNEIKMTANGQNVTNFTYDNYSHSLTYAATLLTGSNTYVITATNAYGNDTKTANITYKDQPVNSNPPPVVTITNPAQSPFTASQATTAVTATIQNITSKNQIQVLYNGVANTNFSFTPSTKTFSITCNLVTGNNTLKITATNSVGTDSKTQIIVYQRPVVVPKPVVTITTPSANPFTVSTSISPVKATVTNVSSSSDITVRVNGTSTNAFSFDAATKQVAVTVNLIQGNNTISIKGVNQSGEDTDTQTIIYNKPAEIAKENTSLSGRTAKVETAPKNPPVVTFINPSNGTSTSSATSYSVEATVLNVGGASGISVKVNNTTVSNFNYNPATQKVTFNANLIRGNNTISITGTNGNGTDSKSVNITRVGT